MPDDTQMPSDTAESVLVESSNSGIATEEEESISSDWTDCSVSPLGVNLISLDTTDFEDTTGPELIGINQRGIYGLVGATTLMDAEEYFPFLDGWERALLCNSLACLEGRLSNAASKGLEFELFGYGPERLGGVPDEEKFNLPWAVQEANHIADQANKELLLGFSTKQLHIEALERGFGWDNPGYVVEMLAPYGHRWLIQAADEYNNPNDPNYGHYGPILSQRHFVPGPEWRTEVEKWTQWIRSANPNIEIWIQLALHRIGLSESNQPSAELALQYREWLINPSYGPALVDGVYISSTYSWPVDSKLADLELEKVFLRACGIQDATPTHASESSQVPSLPETLTPTAPSPHAMKLVEQGVVDGYYYWLYENARFPCGAGDGNHEFLVLQSGSSVDLRSLLMKFPGGGVGFYYENTEGDRVYYPHENATGLTLARYNRNLIFRVALKEGLTKKFRDRADFRILVPSYCSHDLYYGTGQYNPIDDFSRWGYLASMEAVQFVEQEFPTDHIITYGGSSGASGAFFVGINNSKVDGIIMDSQAVDLSGIRDACLDDQMLFGPSNPCYCPDGSDVTCMEVLGERIGFTLGKDEPYVQVRQGIVDTPIFYIWNEEDGSRFAYRQFQNLHDVLDVINPGGNSVAKMVCIQDPNIPGRSRKCNLHVPTAYEYEDTIPLIDEIFQWVNSVLQ
jgi:hypothetical protein